MLFYTRFQVNSDVNDLHDNMQAILDWLDRFVHLSVSAKDWQEYKLAIVEGFTNVVNHAHKQLPSDTPIHIELTGYSNYLEVCIWDVGPPFDLLAYLDALPDQPDPDLPPDGRGLPIIRQVADDLGYPRMPDKRNCLVMSRHRTGAGKADPEPAPPKNDPSSASDGSDSNDD